jgi:hypothetical protein
MEHGRFNMDIVTFSLLLDNTKKYIDSLLLTGTGGKPLGAVATPADLPPYADHNLNDWIYVIDDTPRNPGETWHYVRGTGGWIPLVRVNEAVIPEDGVTLQINNGKREIKDGGVGDAKIGNRTLEDQDKDGALVPVTAKGLAGWLQGIRNNLKALFGDKMNKSGDEMSGDLDMNANKIVEVLRIDTTEIRSRSGVKGDAIKFGGPIDMQEYAVENVKSPVSDKHAVNKKYVDDGLAAEKSRLSPYKGANNQAGILIDLGAEVAGAAEILFDILYNETESGNLKRQAHIHGQFYGDMGSRTGMVQNGNVSVPVYIFKSTPEGIGNTHNYMWIPSSVTSYFPSAKVEAWARVGAGLFDALPVEVSTLTTEPVEPKVPISIDDGWRQILTSNNNLRMFYNQVKKEGYIDIHDYYVFFPSGNRLLATFPSGSFGEDTAAVTFIGYWADNESDESMEGGLYPAVAITISDGTINARVLLPNTEVSGWVGQGRGELIGSHYWRVLSA